MSLNQWWYMEMGERFGPFSDAQMRALAGRGSIDAHTPVFSSAKDGWTTAGQAGFVVERVPWSDGALAKSKPVTSQAINGAGKVTKVSVLRGGGAGRDDRGRPVRSRDERRDSFSPWSMALSLACCVGGLSAWAPWVRVPVVGEMNGWAFGTTWPAWAIAGGFLAAAVAAWLCRGNGFAFIAGVAIPAACACGSAAWMLDRVGAVLARHEATEAGRRAIEASGSGVSWGLHLAILCGCVAILGSMWAAMACD